MDIKAEARFNTFYRGTMIQAIFLIGSFWFWMLIAFSLLFTYIAIENENDFWPGALVFVTFVALWLFGDFNIFKWIYAHPIHFSIGAAVYILGGMIWATVKWWFKCLAFREELQLAKDSYVASESARIENQKARIREMEQKDWRGFAKPEMAEAIPTAWKDSNQYSEYVSSIGNYKHDANPLIPKITKFKSKIMSWMTYWPFSLTWAIMHDLLKKMWTGIYRAISNKLQSIANKLFANAGDDVIIAK